MSDPNKLLDNIKGENIMSFSEGINKLLYAKAAEGLNGVSPDVCKQIAEGDPLHEGLLNWITSTIDRMSRSMKSKDFNKKLRSLIKDTIGELGRLEKAVKAKDIKKVIIIVQTLGRDHLPQIIAHIDVLDRLNSGENVNFDIPVQPKSSDDEEDDYEEDDVSDRRRAEFASGTVEDLLAASHNVLSTSWDLISLHEAELSPEQKAYKELFDKIIKKYDADSPNDLSDEEKKKFFNELEKERANHPDNEPEANEDEEEE